MTAPNFLDGLFGSGVQLGATAGADIGGGAGINGAAITAAKSDHTHRVGGVFAGATALTFGAVADGEFVKRVGSTLVSAAVSAGSTTAQTAATAAAAASLVGTAGSLLIVETNLGVYQWSAGTSFSVDPGAAEVITSTGGQWVRLAIPHRKWGAQNTWYVDNSASGSDYAAGTIGAPLRTLAEVSRRLSGLTGVEDNIAINLVGSAGSEFDWLHLDLTFKGSASARVSLTASTTTRLTQATTTVTSWVAAVPASNTYNTLTMAATRASLSGTGLRFRVTVGFGLGGTGIRAPAGQVPASANAVFCSDPSLLDAASPTINPSNFVPAAASTIVWEKLPLVYSLNVRLRNSSLHSKTVPVLAVHGVRFEPGDINVDLGGRGFATFTECDFVNNATIRGPVQLINCLHDTTSTAPVSEAIAIRGGMYEKLEFVGHAGLPLVLSHHVHAVDVTPVGVVNQEAPFALLGQLTLRARNQARWIGTEQLYGANGTGVTYAAVIEPGCIFVALDDRPTAAGSTNHVLVGATASTWAAAAVDATILAGVCDY